MRSAGSFAALLLGLVSLAHLIRFAFRVDVIVGGWAVPMWMSAAACVVSGGLAIMLWRERRRS
jgi:hypothetical protein